MHFGVISGGKTWQVYEPELKDPVGVVLLSWVGEELLLGGLSEREQDLEKEVGGWGRASN